MRDERGSGWKNNATEDGFWYNVRMRKNRVIEQNRCYHLVSRLAHRAFFLDDAEKDRAVVLMRRVDAGVQAIMSYCINKLFDH